MLIWHCRRAMQCNAHLNITITCSSTSSSCRTRISRSRCSCFCSLSTHSSAHHRISSTRSSFIYLINQPPCPCTWARSLSLSLAACSHPTDLASTVFLLPCLTSPSCVFTRHPHKHNNANNTISSNMNTAQFRHHTRTSARLPMTSCPRTTLSASPLSRQRLAHPMACSSRPALQRTMLEMSS